VLLDLPPGRESGWDLLELIDTLSPQPSPVVFSASDLLPGAGRRSRIASGMATLLEVNRNQFPARRRAGDSMASVTPKPTMRSGSGRPRASAAQASPIAAEVWMP